MIWGNSAPFGELLATWRMRRHLTQADLAAAVGVHRNTIGRWERGDGLPETKGIVLELARQLGLDGQEDRLLLEASLTGLTPYWTVPFWRNPSFTGRDTSLRRLRVLLAPAAPGARIHAVALTGLGGIGKTQLAVEYAYRYALDYRAVFWLGAETFESLMASVRQIADCLQLPERLAAEQGQMVAAVRRWLITHTDWLIIADEVDTLDSLQTVLPSMRNGALLLTTRRQTMGALAEILEVPPLCPEEGVEFVLKRARRLGRRYAGAEATAATELVHELAGLPLALDQAGAYVEDTGCCVADYLHYYQSQRKQALAHRGSHGGGHPTSVTTTLMLSVDHIERTHPGAADLLRLCAFLHSEAIPDELLIIGMAQLAAEPSDKRTRETTSFEFDAALEALRHASLVTRHSETRTCSVHRLVQAVLRDQMEPAAACLWSERVVRLLYATFPQEEMESWSTCERLLPHALTLISTTTGAEQDCDQELMRQIMEVLQRAGGYLAQRGQYQQAEAVFQRMLSLESQNGGSNHLQIVTSLERLAFLAGEQGRYASAEALLRRALDRCDLAPGTNHSEVARLLTRLADVVSNRGLYEQAEPLYERALCIWEQPLESGPGHLDMARALNGLGLLRNNQGKHEEAERLVERALQLREDLLGSMHPDVAMTLNTMGAIYQEQGRFEQAGLLYEQALRIWEQTLGLNHPDVAFALNNLGEIACARQRYERAKAFSWRALHAWKRALGLDHVLIAYPLYNLAAIAHAQGREDRAEALYKRALRLREYYLDASHPTITLTLLSLATLYRTQGRNEQAGSLYQRALAIEEKRLGPTHPQTVIIRRGYQEVQEALE